MGKIREKVREYGGKSIRVRWDAGRCIHAAECVKRLPAVFDPEGRPWIDPDRASAEKVADAVAHCPTGALRFERDGVEGPSAPSGNTITIARDGPAFVSGDVVVRLADGSEKREAHAALCRCGASQRKPYCDGSHTDAEFSAAGHADHRFEADARGATGPLVISAKENGPILLEGSYVLITEDGARPADDGALCRCGASGAKPACDGSHRAAGFRG